MEVRAVALEDGATEEDGWTPPEEVSRLRAWANEETQALILDSGKRKAQVDSMVATILKHPKLDKCLIEKAKGWSATLKDAFDQTCIIQKVIDGAVLWNDPPELELLQILAEKAEEMERLIVDQYTRKDMIQIFIDIREKYLLRLSTSHLCDELIKNPPRKMSTDDEKSCILLSENFSVQSWIGEHSFRLAILHGSFKLFKKFFDIISRRNKYFNTFIDESYCVEYAIVSRNIEILDFMLSLDRICYDGINFTSTRAIESALKICDPQIIKRLQLVPEIQASPKLLAMLTQPSS